MPQEVKTLRHTLVDMIKKYFLKLSLLIIVSFLLSTGCSSSSSSIRYQTEKEKSSEEKSAVRFSSAEENQNVPPPLVYQTDSVEAGYFQDEDDAEEFPEEEHSFDLSEVMSRLNSTSPTDLAADKSTDEEKILMEIIKYLNTPYKYGGNSKNGIDCSAFTQTVYLNTLSIPLLRTARDQYTMGIVIGNREDLEFGDLVFFNTRRRVRPGHVGIYIGDNLFAHASSKHGVIVSSLDHEYYSKRFMGGRRIEGKLDARL